MLEILYRIYEVADEETAKKNRENDMNFGIFSSTSKAENTELVMDCKVCDSRDQFKEIIAELHNFMFEKSNSANVEPVFTDGEGKEHYLDDKSAVVINDILEQAFIPFLAKAVIEEGYEKRETCNYIETVMGNSDEDKAWVCDKCGEAWTLMEGGTPKSHNMHFCPQCGAKITECIPKEKLN